MSDPDEHLSDREKFRKYGYVDTPQRRHNLYCYCTHRWAQDSAVFFILVENWRKKRQKRQAQFINDWFIQGNIPDELTKGGYMMQVNLSPKLWDETNANVTNGIAAVGKTFADKRARHGGGFTGFLGAVGQKLFTDTSLADEKVFNEAQNVAAVVMQGNNDSGFFGTRNPATHFLYNPDATWQHNPIFDKQLPVLKRYLTMNGFSPVELGIY